MEHTSATHSHHKRGIHFDSRLRFHSENLLGAKIYIDSINRYAVKIEEQSTVLDLAPWVNYQGDCYMGQDESMYLLTTSPYKVDRLGNLMPNINQTEPVMRNGIRMRTPPEFAPRESDAKPRVSITAETSGSRPEPSGSMHELSGHPEIEVPTEPLLTTTMLLEGTPTQTEQDHHTFGSG